MNKILNTKYNGYLFRSRLEARWAVFFDACGVEYEYEPEGFDLGDGLHYLPDFKLKNVILYHGFGKIGHGKGIDIHVEVKGEMTEEDAIKIKRFADFRDFVDEEGYDYSSPTNPILVLPALPKGESMAAISENISNSAYEGCNGTDVCPFNYELLDGDYYACYPGVGKDGRFMLFGDDSNYLCDMDDVRTLMAFDRARRARFEFGETPKGGKGI